MSEVVPIGVDFHFYGTLLHEGEWWVSHCPALDVASQGRSPEEARANLREAVQLFIESCSARGTLLDALRELGLTQGTDQHLRRGRTACARRQQL